MHNTPWTSLKSLNIIHPNNLKKQDSKSGVDIKSHVQSMLSKTSIEITRSIVLTTPVLTLLRKQARKQRQANTSNFNHSSKQLRAHPENDSVYLSLVFFCGYPLSDITLAQVVSPLMGKMLNMVCTFQRLWFERRVMMASYVITYDDKASKKKKINIPFGSPKSF